jgi:hypothetical protein
MRTFTFFIHTASSVVPSLLVEAATDEDTARKLARAALTQSPARLMVEVREEDRLLFTVDRNGASWGQRKAGNGDR